MADALALQGKPDDAARYEYDMHLWAASNVNTLQNIEGDELSAAEDVLDIMKRAAPSEAKSFKDSADKRLSDYTSERSSGESARKESSERAKKLSDLEIKVGAAGEKAKQTRTEVEARESALKTLIEEYRSIHRPAAGQGAQYDEEAKNYLVARNGKYRDILDARRQLAESKRALLEAGKSLDALNKELEALKKSIESSASAIADSYEREKRQFDIRTRKIGRLKDSFDRAADDYLEAICKADEKAEDVMENSTRALVSLCDDSDANAPGKAAYVIKAIKSIEDGLESMIKDRKTRARVRKNLGIVRVRIAEKMMKRDDILEQFKKQSGQAGEIALKFTSRGEDIEVRVLITDLIKILAKDDSALSLYILIAACKSPGAAGLMAKMMLIDMIYRITGVEKEKAFPDINGVLNAAALRMAGKIIDEEDLDKKEDQKTPVKRAMRMDAARSTILGQLIGAELAGIFDRISKIHRTDKPWEKMNEADKIRLLAEILGQSESDKADLRIAARSIGDTGYALLARARDAQARGDNDEALNLYREAASSGLDSPQLHYMTGELLYKMELFKEAIKSYELALDKGSYEDEEFKLSAYERLAGIYHTLNMREEERSLHEKRARLLYGYYEDLKKQGKPRDELKGNLESASQAIDRALSIGPNYAASIIIKAKALNELAGMEDDLAAASSMRKESLALCDRLLYWQDIPALEYPYFRIYKARKMFDIFDAKKVEKDARALRARIYYNEADAKRAYKSAKGAIAMGEKTSEMNMIVAGRQTSPKKRRKYLEDALKDEPLNTAARDRLFETLRELKDYDAIIAECDSEEAAIGRLERFDARLDELKARKAAAMLEKVKRLKRFYMGDIKDIDEARRMMAEAEALTKDDSIRTEISNIKDRITKGILTRLKIRGTLAYLLSVVRMGRRSNIDLIWNLKLRLAGLYREAAVAKKDEALLTVASDILEDLVRDKEAGKETKDAARKELSLNLTERALLMVEEGNIDRIELLSRALSLDPDNTRARLERGILYAGLEGFEGFSRADLESALERAKGLERIEDGQKKLLKLLFLNGEYEKWIKLKDESNGQFSAPVQEEPGITKLDNMEDSVLKFQEISKKVCAIDEEIAALEKTKPSRASEFQAVIDRKINSLKSEREALNTSLRSVIAAAGGEIDANIVMRILEVLRASEESDLKLTTARLKVIAELVKNSPLRAEVEYSLAAIYERARNDDGFDEVKGIFESAHAFSSLSDRLKLAGFMLMDARRLSRSKNLKDMIKGFAVLGGMVGEGLLGIEDGAETKHDISGRWIEAFDSLVKAYRDAQKESGKLDDAESNAELYAAILGALESVNRSQDYGLSHIVIRTPQALKNMCDIIFSPGMPVPEAKILNLMLFYGNVNISDDDRNEALERAASRIKTAVARSEAIDLDGLEEFAIALSKNKTLKPAANKILGFIYIARGRFAAARSKLGKREYNSLDTRAIVAYLKARSCQSEKAGNFISRWQRMRDAIKYYNIALKGNLDSLSIEKRLAEIYLRKGDLEEAMTHAEKAYSKADKDEDKKEIDDIKIAILVRKVKAPAKIGLRTDKESAARTILEDIDNLVTAAADKVGSLDIKAEDMISRINKARAMILKARRGGAVKRINRWLKRQDDPEFTKEEKLRNMNIEARIQLNFGQIYLAQALFDDMLNIDMSNIDAIMGLRDCMVAYGDRQGMAIIYNEEALKADSRAPYSNDIWSKRLSVIYAQRADTGISVRAPISNSFIALSGRECAQRAVDMDRENLEAKVILAERCLYEGDVTGALSVIDPLRDKDAPTFVDFAKKADDAKLDGASLAQKLKDVSDNIKGTVITSGVTGRRAFSGGVERYCRVVESLAQSEELISNIRWQLGEMAKMRAEIGSGKEIDKNKFEETKTHALRLLAAAESRKAGQDIRNLSQAEAISKLEALLEQRKVKYDKAVKIYKRRLSSIGIESVKAQVVGALIKMAEESTAHGRPFLSLKILEQAGNLAGDDERIKLSSGMADLAIAKDISDTDKSKVWFDSALKKADELIASKNDDMAIDAYMLTLDIEKGLLEVRSANAAKDISKTDKARRAIIRQIEMDSINAQNVIWNKLLNKIYALPEAARAKFLARYASGMGKFIDTMGFHKMRKRQLAFMNRIIGTFRLDKAGSLDLSEAKPVINMILSEYARLVGNEKIEKGIIDSWTRALIGFINELSRNSGDFNILEKIVNLNISTKGRLSEAFYNIISRKDVWDEDRAASMVDRLNSILEKDTPEIEFDPDKMKVFYNMALDMLGKESKGANYGLGLAYLIDKEYSKAVSYLKRGPRTLAEKYNLVKAMMNIRLAPLTYLKAKWIAFNMWRESRYSTFTQDAIKATGLLRSIFSMSPRSRLTLLAIASLMAIGTRAQPPSKAQAVPSPQPVGAVAKFDTQIEAPEPAQLPHAILPAAVASLSMASAAAGNPLKGRPVSSALIMAGITGDISEDEMAALREKYEDVIFVKLGNIGPDEAIEKLKSEPSDVLVRIVTDFRSSDEVIGRMSDIVGAARVQAFIMAYPYIASLNEGDISSLNRDTLTQTFDILQRLLPQARSLDLDFILSNPALPEHKVPVSAYIDRGAFFAAVSGILPSRPAQYMDTKTSLADTGEWAAAYADALSKKDKVAIESMEYDLAVYLRGRDASEIEKIISAISDRASVAGVIDRLRGTDAGIAGQVIDEINNSPGSGICVSAFDASILSEKTRKYISDFIASPKPQNNRVEIVVFGAAESPPQGIPLANYIKVMPGEPVAEKIAQRFKEISRISISTAKDRSDAAADIESDLRQYQNEALSYVVLPRGEQPDNVFQINISALLYSVRVGRVSFIALGFDNGDFSDIRSILNAIGGFFMIIRASKAISEILYAIKVTAKSV